jgi:NAD(P)-dependent dehydrogenase (short-subunit alcohol dehydrogenase family)
MARFTDRALLVSGSTGIAAATAELAVAEGARVCAVSLDAEAGAALVARLGAERCAHLTGDLTSAEVADAAVRLCVDRFGRVDALFNIAGASGRRQGDGPVHECTDAGWDFTLAVNARTTFLLCRAGLRQMLAQAPGPSGHRGVVLNMASVLALDPEPRGFATHAYAAAKGAVLSLTRAMAATYASQGIRVNAIAPSLVRTPMSRRAQEDPAILALMQTKQPLAGELLPVEDVARSALYLLCDDSRMVTGETLVVDGGWRVS